MEKRVKQTNVPDDLPRSPTGRVPKWVIDEAAGRRVDPQPWRPPGSALPDMPSAPMRRRRSKWWWVAAVLLVTMAVGAVAAYLR